MQKRLVLLVAILGCALFTSFAWAQNYGTAGCGLGSMLFEGNNGKGPQILAATTNGTSGNQTFGITSGTLNCTTDGMVKQSMAQQAFAEVNFEDLSQEMAKGHGEHLRAFAHLFGCSAESVDTFGHVVQQHYSDIFPSADVTPADLIQSVKQHIATNPALANSCQA